MARKVKPKLPKVTYVVINYNCDNFEGEYDSLEELADRVLENGWTQDFLDANIEILAVTPGQRLEIKMDGIKLVKIR